MMTGGIRSCSNAEEKMNRVKRKETWGPGTPIPEQPMRRSPHSHPTLNPRLFDHAHAHHVQIGCAYARPPSSPVCARRSTRTQFGYPKARNNPRRWWIPYNRRFDSLARSSTATRPHPSRLALANVYSAQLPRRLSNVNAGSAVTLAQMGPAVAPPCHGRVSP